MRVQTFEEAAPSPRADARPAGGERALFINVQSRSGEKALAPMRRALEKRAVHLSKVRAVRRPEKLREKLEDALAHGVRTFLIGGGDGTISSAARVLAGTGATLGVLPLGTGNDFARSLGIPFGLEEACDVIAEGRVIDVDVGLANGRPFLNAASVGLSCAITRRLSVRLKRLIGRLAYPVVAVQSSLEHPPFRVRLAPADGPARELEVLQVVVGNGRFHGGGALVSNEATLADKRLHVYAILSGLKEPREAGLRKLSGLARVAMHLRSGTQEELENVAAFATSALRLESEEPHEVDVDGELLGTTPVTFSVWPGALRVFVPKK